MIRRAPFLFLLLTAPAWAQLLPIVPCPQTGPAEGPCLALPAPAPSRSGATVQLQAGAGYRSLYGLPYGVGEATVLIGKDWRRAALYGRIHFEAGAPELDLPIVGFDVGALVEAKLGRVRIGGGPALGVILVPRVTNAEVASGLAWRLDAVVSVDLWARGRRALFLGVEGGLALDFFQTFDLVPFTVDVSPVATAFLGARL